MHQLHKHIPTHLYLCQTHRTNKRNNKGKHDHNSAAKCIFIHSHTEHRTHRMPFSTGCRSTFSAGCVGILRIARFPDSKVRRPLTTVDLWFVSRIFGVYVWHFSMRIVCLCPFCACTRVLRDILLRRITSYRKNANITFLSEQSIGQSYDRSYYVLSRNENILRIDRQLGRWYEINSSKVAISLSTFPKWQMLKCFIMN